MNENQINKENCDEKSCLLEIVVKNPYTYDIDDVDGMLYMLEHRFSGCLPLRFTKTMDETVYGHVTCGGQPLPEGFIKTVAITDRIKLQLLGVPVRTVCTDYDTEYEFVVEGFKDTEGNVMAPQTVAVKTLPRRMPDMAYAGHDEVALDAAREGIVLLKNEDNLLPLAPDAQICVAGASWFRVAAVGAGRINPRYSIGLLRGLKEYSQLRLAENADTGLIVISRPSGENFDNNAVKGEYYLSDAEEEAIRQLCGRCRHVIAVLNTGYPIDVRWIKKYHIAAALWCGFPGMLGGRALVEILDGRVAPSGKLPDTWSLDYKDIPAAVNFYQPEDAAHALGADSGVFIDTCYEEDIYVGYRYFETFGKPVAYPFGFGLSYTDFNICASFVDGVLRGTVSNVGACSGKAVVQVYGQIPDGKLEQPRLRLVEFLKTRLLEPGEQQAFEILINNDHLKSFDAETSCWVMEAGHYGLFVGDSVKNVKYAGGFDLAELTVLGQSEPLMCPPVTLDVLSKRRGNYPTGSRSGIKEGATALAPLRQCRTYPAAAGLEAQRTCQSISEASAAPEAAGVDAFVDRLSVYELARLSVCASHGWGMHEKGEAGRLYRLEKYHMPRFTVADGNNGVNLNRPNIGMPCSNTVCATWNRELAWNVGRVIAEEARENDIQMILAPAMNIHRNPLNGRHPEYFSEDPYLAGIMAGFQGKGLEDNGVSSCIKHTVANNCESSRKRNHSIISLRALREIYLRVFEVAMSVYSPDSMMTGYNAVNGCFTAEDAEMIQGIFRQEFGFTGFVMTDWNSYDTADVAAAVQAGNTWMTPGSEDDTYVTPIVEGVAQGRIDLERLRSNVRYMLRVVARRTGWDMR